MNDLRQIAFQATMFFNGLGSVSVEQLEALKKSCEQAGYQKLAESLQRKKELAAEYERWRESRLKKIKELIIEGLAVGKEIIYKHANHRSQGIVLVIDERQGFVRAKPFNKAGRPTLKTKIRPSRIISVLAPRV